jgi:hypothetical protein
MSERVIIRRGPGWVGTLASIDEGGQALVDVGGEVFSCHISDVEAYDPDGPEAWARIAAEKLGVRFCGRQVGRDGPGFWMFQDDAVTRSSFTIPADTPKDRIVRAVEVRLASVRFRFGWNQKKARLSYLEANGDGWAAGELEAMERMEALA